MGLKSKTEIQRRWRRANPHICASNTRRYQARLRKKALEVLGNKCVRCGFLDERALQIDHVNGNGRTERAKLSSHRALYRHVVQHPSHYQLLCANCNWIKRVERREYGNGKTKP